jgi:hypothetical protein
MEATVLLSIYLRIELTLIDTRVLSARCPLADVPGSACEAPPPRHLATETRPTHNNLEREGEMGPRRAAKLLNREVFGDFSAKLNTA